MGRKYGDHGGHGNALAASTNAVIAEQRDRAPVLGVDPRLIVVVETNRSIPDSDFRPAGLRVVDASSSRAVVAFADDPQLAAFLDRLGQYGAGPAAGQKNPSFIGFFDAIDGIRPYGRDDRISDRLKDAMASAAADSMLLIDAECWYPGTSAEADTWLDEVALAVGSAGGLAGARYINADVGLAMIRLRVPAGRLPEIGDLDVIATLDLLPAPPLWWSELATKSADDLPDIPAPSPDAPIVGLIDSGVRSAHPLLAGSIVDAVAGAGQDHGEDRNGHGTAVAARLLHGDIEALISSAVVPAPPCQILSVRVLDDHNEFPKDVVLAEEIELALRTCAAAGARIINLCVADRATPFLGGHSTPVAAVVDQVARELGLIVIVSAGNVNLPDYLAIDASMTTDYPAALVQSEATAILDPAPSALAITVGGRVHKATPLDHDRLAIGDITWPSPFSRRGPGIAGALKPEVSASAGTLAFDPGFGSIVSDANLGCVSADGSSSTGMLASDCGTSFAAPMVSRVAAGVKAQYPEFGPNLVKALVLQAADESLPECLADFPGVGVAGRATLTRSLVGYGEPGMGRACFSDSHRVVLVAEDEIEVDAVHLYEVPIPESFFDSGGKRGITVSLCFDPDVRARRLDYMSSRMRFELVRGIGPDEVVSLFVALDVDDEDAKAADSAEDLDDEEAEREEAEAAPDDAAEPRTRLSELKSRERPPLSPSTTERSAGANQLGRKTFSTVLKREDGESFLLVVKNTRSWAPAGTKQPYAVAVTLWRTDDHGEIYTELEAEIESRLEARAEAEVRG
jgi:hypothetical protein